MNLGEKIKKIRELKGITQKDLAEKSNISRGYLISIEKGKKPSIEVLYSISNALNVTLNALLESESEIQSLQKDTEKNILEKLIKMTTDKKMNWNSLSADNYNFNEHLLDIINEYDKDISGDQLNNILYFSYPSIEYFIIPVIDFSSVYENQAPTSDYQYEVVIYNHNNNTFIKISEDTKRLEELYSLANPKKSEALKSLDDIMKSLSDIDTNDYAKNEENKAESFFGNNIDDDNEVPF